MVHSSPVVLILGHSFVRRLCHDLETGFDQRADLNFNLKGTAVVFMHGVGGRTVPKLRMFDLHVVKQLSQDIIILEIGTNDLTRVGPEVVGSEIDDFVRFLVDNLAVRVVGNCHVIPRVSHVPRPISHERYRFESVHERRFRRPSQVFLLGAHPFSFPR